MSYQIYIFSYNNQFLWWGFSSGNNFDGAAIASLVNFTFFSLITYNFLYVEGPVSHFRIGFWTPKSDIRKIKKWKRDVGDEGAPKILLVWCKHV